MNLLTITRSADADLSAKQYFIVKATASNGCALAGAGDIPLGVLTNDPESGEAAAIQVAGVVRVTAGAGFAVGARVKADAAGKAITLVNGAGTKEQSIGIALEAATNDGDIVEILLLQAASTTPA